MPAPKRVPPDETGTFRTEDGLDLYWAHWHSTASPRGTIAIVHGFGEHCGRYGNLIAHLIPLGFEIYGFDLRGHGRSPGPRGHIDTWAQYRNDVRTYLGMIREQNAHLPIFLYGHSMGGLIVLDYALHFPRTIAGVIASGPVLAQPGVSPILLAISRVVSRLWPSLTLNTGLDATALSRDPDVVQAYIEDPLVHSKASARLGTEISATVEWVHAHARQWQVPLLILHGEADRLSPVEGSRRFFESVVYPDKTLTTYPGGFHEPHNDIQKEQVLDDVTRWLNAHLPEES